MDEFMFVSSDFVRVIICDGESCNNILKDAVFGRLGPAHRRRLLQTKFFQHLTHRAIPGLSILPHVPYQMCFFKDEPIYCLSGVAHAVKNSAGQTMSETKVLFYGKHFVDSTGALQFSLPVPAYCRKDAMSDRLTSLLSNPYFLIRASEPCCRFGLVWEWIGMVCFSL